MTTWGLMLLGTLMMIGVLAGVIGAESRPEEENPGARQKQKPAQVIWAGESGGFRIRWNKVDIQAHPSASPSRVIFSARSLAQQEFARFKANEKKHGLNKRYCEVVYSYKILSVAGSLMSFFEETGVDCKKTAHPSETNRFTVIDLKKPGGVSKNRVKLTDYFPGKAIYQALLADPRVQKALARRKPPLPQSPRNLAELCAGLKYELLDDGECSYFVSEDFLTRFAFHHLEGAKVAVRLALPIFGEVFRGHYLELNLLLPVPESLKEPLALAQTGKAGFLMQDQSRLTGGEYNDFTMRFTKGKESPDRYK
jgi:hypothetical protein